MHLDTSHVSMSSPTFPRHHSTDTHFTTVCSSLSFYASKRPLKVIYESFITLEETVSFQHESPALGQIHNTITIPSPMKSSCGYKHVISVCTALKQNFTQYYKENEDEYRQEER